MACILCALTQVIREPLHEPIERGAVLLRKNKLSYLDDLAYGRRHVYSGKAASTSTCLRLASFRERH